VHFSYRVIFMCRTYKTSSSLGAVAAPFHSLSHSNNKLRRQPRFLLKYSKLPLRPLSLHPKHQQFLCQSPRRCHSQQARLLLVVPLCMSPCISQSNLVFVICTSSRFTLYLQFRMCYQMAVHSAYQVCHFSLALAPDSLVPMEAIVLCWQQVCAITHASGVWHVERSCTIISLYPCE